MENSPWLLSSLGIPMDLPVALWVIAITVKLPGKDVPKDSSLFIENYLHAIHGHLIANDFFLWFNLYKRSL